MVQRRISVLAGALVVAVALAACDGSSAFSSNTIPPELLSLEAPTPVESGQSFTVSVRAVGAVPMDTIVVRVQGSGVNLEQRLEGESRELDMQRQVSFDLPLSMDGTQVTVSARAVDVGGLESRRVETSVSVVDRAPPSASVSVSPQEVGQEEAVTFQVQASDNVELRRVGVRVEDGSGSRVFADSVLVTGSSVTRSFTWNVPSGQPVGTYQVVGFALDQEANRGESSARSLDIVFNDETPPDIEFLAPEAGSEWGTGEVIRMRARLTDNDELASATLRAVVRRGDPELGTEEEVVAYTAPAIQIREGLADTTVVRDLTPNGDAESGETVYIILEATDASGNVGRSTLAVVLAGSSASAFLPSSGALGVRRR
ncbi:MAG: hypothetical protein EA352_03710 [Gemmatimonadales bacterium]|nr:MAG: hypothetical protein EA352_03710 [Gemmatimonadales bacterium]